MPAHACSCVPDVVFAHCVTHWDKNWLTHVQVRNERMRLMLASGMDDAHTQCVYDR